MTLGLFQGYGIELEYMIVSRRSLEVLPIADQLLQAMAGEPAQSWEADGIGWSNELALHVIEFKTAGPVPTLAGLDRAFRRAIGQANLWLHEQDACLLGTAMHPFMDPGTIQLWPHGDREIYQAFDRIFDCKGHGWGNLQSMHINLPFADDQEFARLHAAVRFLLPLLPAVAASSPLVEGSRTSRLCNRYFHYRDNCRRIPSVTARVIPEPVSSRAEYEQRILEPMYRDIAPYDKEKILQFEWLNARGAIARFDRMALEIRLMDIQAEPEADLALAEIVSGLARLLTDCHWSDSRDLNLLETEFLKRLLDAAAESGLEVEVGDRALLSALGMDQSSVTMRGIWEWVADQLVISSVGLSSETQRQMEKILSDGSAASRILNALGSGPNPDRSAIRRVYRELAARLNAG